MADNKGGDRESNRKRELREAREAREALLRNIEREGPDALKDAHKNMKADVLLVSEAVKQNGMVLEHADDSLKANREVVIAAVKQWGSLMSP